MRSTVWSPLCAKMSVGIIEVSPCVMGLAHTGVILTCKCKTRLLQVMRRLYNLLSVWKAVHSETSGTDKGTVVLGGFEGGLENSLCLISLVFTIVITHMTRVQHVIAYFTLDVGAESPEALPCFTLKPAAKTKTVSAMFFQHCTELCLHYVSAYSLPDCVQNWIISASMSSLESGLL